MEWRKVRRYDLKRPVVLTVGGPMTPPPDTTAERLEQIKAALHVEWRLKAQGVHHDHLSDLAFLIAEVEHLQSKHAQQAEEIARLRVAYKKLVGYSQSRWRQIRAQRDALAARVRDLEVGDIPAAPPATLCDCGHPRGLHPSTDNPATTGECTRIDCECDGFKAAAPPAGEEQA